MPRNKQSTNIQGNFGAIYTRFSSHNQREESNEAQVRACLEYAKRNGIDVIKIYSDSAKSGTTSEREQFLQMIQDSEKGMFSNLLIYKFDRFARNKYDSVIFKRKLRENGVKIISITELLGDSPEDVILESLLEGMAQYFSMSLSRDVMRGMRESAYSCTHLGGLPPLGYDVEKDTKKYVINETEAVIIRTIFEKYADGIPSHKIIEYLNGMGYKSQLGKSFTQSSLAKILRNEKYKGTYVFNKSLQKDVSGNRKPMAKPKNEWIVVEDGMPAIIDAETFDKVQVKLKLNFKHGGKFKAREVYLLSSLVVCGECGSTMYGNSRLCGRSKTKYVSYRCTDRANKRKGCTNKELRKEYLENYVLDELYNKLFSKSSIEKLSSMLNEYNQRKSQETDVELTLVHNELAEVIEKISKIIRLVSEAGISIETLAPELKQLEERKNYLEKHIQEVTFSSKTSMITENNILDLINRSSEFVKTKNVAECRNFIQSYIEKVIVYAEHVEILFKIHVPNDNSDEVLPLKSKTSIEAIREEYKDTV